MSGFSESERMAFDIVNMIDGLRAAEGKELSDEDFEQAIDTLNGFALYAPIALKFAIYDLTDALWSLRSNRK